MATELVAIELPAGRRSYITPSRDLSPTNDHSNPNWIPVLDNVDLQKLSEFMEKGATPSVTPHTPSASYSPFPPRASSPKQRPMLQHNYSKSSLAPETVVENPTELEAEPLPPRSSSKKHASPSPIMVDPSTQHLRHTSAAASSSDGQETVTSDSTADVSIAPSTVRTASLVEEQYYTLPTAPVEKEDIQPPTPQLLSGRSSVASVRTMSSVKPPTSKYNRKNVNPTTGRPPTGRPPTIRSQPTTPHESPRMSPQSTLLPSLPLAEPLPSPQVPFPTEPPPVPESPRLQPSKSTAAERKQRALHSHPSNVSLVSQTRSRANSTSDEDGIAPKPPSIRHKPRKSTDSRGGTPRSTIYDAQPQSPAPTAPLPQLPPEARTRPTTPRPSTRDSHIHRQIQPPPEAYIAPPSFAVKTSDHNRMASFMTTTSQVIFRRFDDVHVKLLLCLQDEIAQLEQELMTLETGASATGDRNLQTMRVMRELRRVVAEYGKPRSVVCLN